MFSNKKKIIINHSKNIDFHTQRNNEIYPLEACGPTSMAMALIQAGYRDWQENKKQSGDDIIASFLTSKKYYKEMENMVGKNTNWKPFNIHALLTKGVNELLKKEVSDFRTNWTLQEILFNIIKGGGAALAGDFTLENGRELGHIVSLAGFITTQSNIEKVNKPEEIKLSKIDTFIIDDPYGNYLKNYEDHKGNNIEFDYKLFYKVFREQNNPNKKWAHLITPA